MPLQAIMPQFSRGITTAMSNAQSGVQSVGDMASKYLADEENKRRYEKDQGRLDRAEARQIEEYERQKAIRQGIIDTEQAKTMATPYVKDVVAFNDPRYAKALEAWQTAGNKDITESDKILSAYLANQPNATQQSQYQLPSIDGMQGGSVDTGMSGQSIGLSGGTRTVTTGRGTRTVPVAGTDAYYTDTNPTVSFREGGVKPILPVAQPKVPTQVTDRNPDGSIITNGDKVRSFVKGVFEPYKGEGNFVDNLMKYPRAINDVYQSNIVDPYTRPLVKGTADAIKQSWDTVNAPLSERQKVLKSELQSFVNPTNSTKLLGATGRASPQQKQEEQFTAGQLLNIPLSGINQDKLFDSKGKPWEINKSSGNAYYQSKDGKHLINIDDVGRAIQNTAKAGTAPSTKVETIPTRTEILSGETAPLNLSMTQIRSVASKNNIAPEAVQMSAGKVNTDYTSFLDLLGRDNNKERDALREMVSSQAAQSGLIPSDYDVSKAVDSIMPSNELTGRQKLFVEASMKNLDAARDDYWKTAQYNLNKAEFDWRRAVDQQKLSLEKIGLNIRMKEASQKVDNTKITMFKKTSDGVQTVEVPASQLDTAINQGFQLGKFGYAPQGAKTTDGKSDINLIELGGRSWLGGTSGADLEAYANRKKAQYPKVPMSAIKAEIASQVGGNYFTDSIDDAAMDKILQGYGK